MVPSPPGKDLTLDLPAIRENLHPQVGAFDRPRLGRTCTWFRPSLPAAPLARPGRSRPRRTAIPVRFWESAAASWTLGMPFSLRPAVVADAAHLLNRTAVVHALCSSARPWRSPQGERKPSRRKRRGFSRARRAPEAFLPAPRGGFPAGVFMKPGGGTRVAVYGWTQRRLARVLVCWAWAFWPIRDLPIAPSGDQSKPGGPKLVLGIFSP